MDLSFQSVIDSLGQRSGTAFALVLPGGARYVTGAQPPAFTVVFRTERALVATFARGHLGLLEAYFDQEVELEGDLGMAMEAGMRSGFDLRFDLFNSVENNLLEWRSANSSPAQAKANARAHYGLGEPFYRLWLDDPLKMYTCGYWSEGTASLEQAQRNKIDHVCRKLRLAPGESFVDIGCGFGGFMFRALETTGALGTGINTTTEQVRWLDGEIRRRGLQEQLRVREADFREVDMEYDKVVSIGVIEHAGRDQLADVIRAHADFLKPGGLGLLHFIGHVGRRDTELFIRKHVFPGGWIPSLADALVEMERFGLEVIDVENLRRHYARTCAIWTDNFESKAEQIKLLTDPRKFRIWHVYLAGCTYAFANDWISLYQIVCGKAGRDPGAIPWSRKYMYT